MSKSKAIIVVTLAHDNCWLSGEAVSKAAMELIDKNIPADSQSLVIPKPLICSLASEADSAGLTLGPIEDKQTSTNGIRNRVADKIITIEIISRCRLTAILAKRRLRDHMVNKTKATDIATKGPSVIDATKAKKAARAKVTKGNIDKGGLTTQQLGRARQTGPYLLLLRVSS